MATGCREVAVLLLWQDFLEMCPLERGGNPPSVYRGKNRQKHSASKHLRGMPGAATRQQLALASITSGAGH